MSPMEEQQPVRLMLGKTLRSLREDANYWSDSHGQQQPPTSRLPAITCRAILTRH